MMTLEAQNKSSNLLSMDKNKHYRMGLIHTQVSSHKVLLHKLQNETAT